MTVEQLKQLLYARAVPARSRLGFAGITASRPLPARMFWRESCARPAGHDLAGSDQGRNPPAARIAEYESRLIRWISYFGCAQIVHSDTVWASSSASCRAASASVARPRADRTSLV